MALAKLDDDLSQILLMPNFSLRKERAKANSIALNSLEFYTYDDSLFRTDFANRRICHRNRIFCQAGGSRIYCRRLATR